MVKQLKQLITEVLKMAYFINDSCIACGQCKDECPKECIEEGDPIYVIDEDECIDCGACLGVCPVESPQPKE